MAVIDDERIPGVAQPDRQEAIDQYEAVRRSGLYRWGSAMARRRRTVLWACVPVLVLAAALLPLLQHTLGAPSLEVSGSESSRVERMLEEGRIPKMGSEDDALVFYARDHQAGDPAYRRVVAAALAVMGRQKGVKGVVSPYSTEAIGLIGGGEHAAVALVTVGGSVTNRFNHAQDMQSAATRAAAGSGIHVWFTGYSPIAREISNVDRVDTRQAEAIGVPVALVVLLVTLGAALVGILPLVLAGIGLLLTFGVLAFLSLFLHLDALIAATVTMVGMGIGIDYSLFIVSRFREVLASSDPEESSQSERIADAVGVALATSGRTILLSGVIVALSLASLYVVSMAFFQEMAIGGVTVVACTLLAAMTLLPATLAVLGPRIDNGAPSSRVRSGHLWRRGTDPTRHRGWARWALMIMRHPILFGGAAVALLLLAAVPVLNLRSGISLGGQQITDTDAGHGNKALEGWFAMGASAPIQIILTGHPGQKHAAVLTAAAGLVKKLENTQQVAGVVEHRGADSVLLTAVATVPVDGPAAAALVRHIRKDLAHPIEARGGPTVLVGGLTAVTVDMADELHAKFPLVLVLVLGLSLLFLLVVLRSVVLPIKAVLMNLLATGATVGIVVLVFQDGHGEHLLGFNSPGFIESYVPLIVFAMLFGLSMDYEVFLIRRMQEEWHRTHDNTLAVVTGIEHTALPITAAAAIMVAVFGCFVTAELMELKQFGFALAAAIALDATLIRLVLVPALMRVFGAWNWWLPAWLDRLLPDPGVD